MFFSKKCGLGWNPPTLWKISTQFIFFKASLNKQGIITLIMDGLAAGTAGEQLGGPGADQLGPAAAYSAQVAAWLQQAYQAQLMQYGTKRSNVFSSR